MEQPSLPAFLETARGQRAMGSAERWEQQHEAELRCRLGAKAQRRQTRQRWINRSTWVAFVVVAMAMASAALRYEDQLQQREHGAAAEVSR